MIGELFINGKDAFLTWGVSLTDDAISSILTPPPNKAFITNSSRREHGSRVVVNDPKVDERDLTILLNMSAPSRALFFDRYKSFCQELKKGELVFKLSYQPEVSYTFIYKNCQQFGQYRLGMAKFLLKLTEYNPEDR